MRRAPERPDLAVYGQALAVYGRNLAVLLPPFVAAGIGVGLDYLGNWLFSATGGALMGLVALAVAIIEGYAFAVSVIFADDAWRHTRANITAAWNSAARRGGDILLTVVGFLFLMWVARLVGGLLPVPYFEYAVEFVALWAFIYAIPAAAIGGVPSGGAFSVSLNAAKRHPIGTAILAIVSLVVYYGLTVFAFGALQAHLQNYGAYVVTQLLLEAVALGYIALIAAKQYADLAFRPYW